MDNINHEFRTPLNIISGISKNLLHYKKDNLTDRQTEGLNYIHTNANRLFSLLEKIIEYKRIESIHIKKVHINHIIQEVHNYAKKISAEKSIPFYINISEEIRGLLQTDMNKLIKLLSIVLDNAFKYTEAGYVKLNIYKKGQKMVFEIIDTGIGIEKSDLKSIFDKFRQLDQVDVKRFSGLGMGLALAKKIARLLKGEIRVTSVINKGSNFKILIPFEIN
jgi:signal transduction histidine kinase